MVHRFVLAAALVATAMPGEAAVLRNATLGCRQAPDAAKVAAGEDVAALRTSRACIPFAKGIAIDVDEDKPPLSCIRLKGDLECWWVPDHAVDEAPADLPAGPASGHHSKP